MTYAEGTSVSVEKSKAELDALLAKHGATQRGIMQDDDAGRAAVMFTLNARQYRLEVPLPRGDQFPSPSLSSYGNKIKTPQGWQGWTVDRRKAWVRAAVEQRSRERWRAMVLIVKGKLEFVQLGLTSVEREFLADLVLPDGRRVHDALEAGIRSAYETGNMPPLLPAGPSGDGQ